MVRTNGWWGLPTMVYTGLAGELTVQIFEHGGEGPVVKANIYVYVSAGR